MFREKKLKHEDKKKSYLLFEIIKIYSKIILKINLFFIFVSLTIRVCGCVIFT